MVNATSYHEQLMQTSMASSQKDVKKGHEKKTQKKEGKDFIIIRTWNLHRTQLVGIMRLGITFMPA